MKQFKTLPTGLILMQTKKKNGSIHVDVVTPEQIKTANKWYVKLINRISI